MKLFGMSGLGDCSDAIRIPDVFEPNQRFRIALPVGPS
jgi:hypothetical protein